MCIRDSQFTLQVNIRTSLSYVNCNHTTRLVATDGNISAYITTMTPYTRLCCSWPINKLTFITLIQVLPALALYFTMTDLIHQFCTFRLSKQPLTPHIKFLDDGRILMTNLSQVTLQCNGTQISIPYCIQCIRTVPCPVSYTHLTLPTKRIV